ncbi:MAG TPA: HRDC domain-containing protein [Candidatus Alectryocaccomicrobium excrementavium]|uniref:HRDC domain-containing protein n=1 Tax=Candidatus Alectryocaccomicrobium excrementavium TaxID=2840668 RepID=A0A9D1FYK5_9FIRM|nr:HRDC domain-containing protein [Candidatus Alectryocaccomicrobium excrementavium]
MAIHPQMYKELEALRQRLKEEGRQAQGRTPVVCSDDALADIAQLQPQKLSDFDGIAGIGKTFVENYGGQFLAVVRKYAQSDAERAVRMGESTVETLKELEKKLVSINRRNRLLYMRRASSKYAYDLFSGENALAQRVLFGAGKPVVVVDVLHPISESAEMEAGKHRKIVQLLREANKDLREKGQNDLYIGYPFVIGRLPGEDFDVRAPLALFPVTAERSATSVELALDESRDIVMNTTLILAHYKFSNLSRPLPAGTVDTVAEEDFLDGVLDFFAHNELPIRDDGREMRRFAEYRAEEFPRFAPGELVLEPCAVLGKFPVCASSIQKDFDEILKRNEINALLSDLLQGEQDVDFYAEEGAPSFEPVGPGEDISERDLTYIRALNGSQETVLCAMDATDELVVQGPPGTGKSQTIIGLIAKFVSAGKTVLMVSEKKTALDVVYSRLGDLHQYALLIDDVGNKEAFYRQLSRMVSLGQRPEGEEISAGGVADDIDGFVQRLRAIASALYTPDDFGIEPYKLYLHSQRIHLADDAQRARAQRIRQERDACLSNLTYAPLSAMHERFSDAAFFQQLETFQGIVEAYPWMGRMRTDLDEYEALSGQEKLEALQKAIAEWKGKNPLVRFFARRRLLEQVDAAYEACFLAGDARETRDFLLEGIDEVAQGARRYTEYQNLKLVYEQLSDMERAYFAALLRIKAAFGEPAGEANDELFNALLNERIAKFEAANRALLRDIEDFDGIVRALGNAISSKQALSRARLERVLAESMLGVTVSKRHGEILRALESKRKWSVNKFIQKFDFELFRSVKIWLLTPEVVSEIIPLQNGIFDLVVFDEASQMYVEKGLPSILRAKKVVVAGDHRQLRPSKLGAGRLETDLEEMAEGADAALEEESLLDLARFRYRDVMLNFHYRSQYEELIAFSNSAFYGGKLHVSPNVHSPVLPPIQVHKLEGARWVDRSNQAEAERIVAMLREFFATRQEEETVGIITFNVGQRELIEDLIDAQCEEDEEFATVVREEMRRRKDGEDIGLFVKNIESVQGDERDVIFFSIGYAANEKGTLAHNFGWLNQRGGENRLNVAISRARKQIHIVTSFFPSELHVEDAKNEGPRILKKYLEYAFAISAGDREGACAILASFEGARVQRARQEEEKEWKDRVRAALVEKGYQVEADIGIGGYTIDLALRKGDAYVLGIECDSSLYRERQSARERDYHRQKYLESRGWRIHRLWSMNWWKDPAREIECILHAAESAAG